ncbi:phosphatase PAP2 family protein [Cryptosporangium aurantiacum]|uniref:Putative flippase GtrA (Transmembrane translocase of bactoprenol-linked glucose) n=1 Tax=Cryptosporangium aurantiacum TaxID=134849 RepID=A0A1M7R8V2_9ACTN|nr:phosphatase PAP2 family protein [Cryptosporangium aurantiacum]SHN42663.1 Putative flippase GtrA (transmembrane translocase of bactoprenol-linked glucose) [Cryptosporangium aurantiacum]
MSSLRLLLLPGTSMVASSAGNTLLRRALREIPLVAVLYLAYMGGRLLASHHTGTAFSHAESVWDFERLIGLPSEYTVQQAALHWSWLVEAMGVYYARVHFPATAAVLIWLFVRRPSAYPWFRWTLALLTGLALIGHVLYPLAPPRMLTGHGMIDTAHVYGQSVYGPVGTGLANQFAAMPSLHVAWAVLVAIALVRTLRSRWRWLAVAHPVITVIVVVVTGNHYWLDGIIGCALLLVALAVVRPSAARTKAIAVAREHVWPFVRFVVVGSASTLLSSVIFVPLLVVMPSAAANTVAAIISTLASNEAHRSWTFRSDRRGLPARIAAAGTVLLSYLVTTGALLVLDLTVTDASTGLKLTVMLAASAVGGLARYLLLGTKIFPAARIPAKANAPQPEARQTEARQTEALQSEPLQAGGVGSPASTQPSALSMASSSAP